MPMVPEAAIAMLACARVGAVHSVVFAGFSAASLADRINDCEAKMVLTSDGNFRGNKTIPVKDVVDEALEKCASIEKSVIVLERTKQNINMEDGRDFWWHNVLRMSLAHVILKLWIQRTYYLFYIHQVQQVSQRVLFILQLDT